MPTLPRVSTALCPLWLPATALCTCSSTLWAMRVAPSSSSATLMGRTRSATWKGRPHPEIRIQGPGWSDRSMRGPQVSSGQGSWVLPYVTIPGILGLKENSAVQGHRPGGGEQVHGIRAPSEYMNFPKEPGLWESLRGESGLLLQPASVTRPN